MLNQETRDYHLIKYSYINSASKVPTTNKKQTLLFYSAIIIIFLQIIFWYISRTDSKLITFFFYLILIQFFMLLIYYTWSFFPTEGLFSTPFMLGIGMFLYYFSIPLELKIKRIDFFTAKVFGNIQLDDVFKTEIFAAGLIAYVAFILGYSLSNYSNELNKLNKTFIKHSSRQFYIRLGILSSLILIIFYRGEIFSSGMSYKAAYLIRGSNSIFSFLIKFTILAFVYGGAFLISNINKIQKAIGYTLIVLCLIWGIYAFDKDPMLIAVLGILSPFLLKKSSNKYSLLKVISGFIIAVLIIPLFSSIFSLYRAGTIDNILPILRDRGVYIHFDSAGPFVSIIYCLFESYKKSFGLSYLDSIVSWIPRFIWENRPIDLSVNFAQNNIKGWMPGMGLGFSLLAESYINFGLFGPLVQYLFLGFAWGVLWKALLKLSIADQKQDVKMIYVIFGNYLLLIMHRAPVSGIVIQIAQFVIPFIVVRSLFNLRRRLAVEGTVAA